MGSLYTLILCSLLLQVEGNAPNQQGLLPDTRQAPFVSTQPITQQVQVAPIADPPPVTAPQTNAKQARFTNGVSMAPKHNHIVLSAPERAGMLLSLATERRDAVGNIVQDSDGNPIMIPIARGMNVFKGQVLGKFEDHELRSNMQINLTQLRVAKAERDKELEIEYADRSLQLTHAELERMHEANRRVAGAFSAMEIGRAALACIQADVKLKLERYVLDEVKTAEVAVRESELDRTKVQIELRRLVSHIDGTVVRINAAEGEWLREGHEILEIVRLDTLEVQVKARVAEYEISDLQGKQAAVRVAFPNGRTETFQGTVVFCNPQVLADETFEVYVEVQNRRAGNFWLLQPGRRDVEVAIAL